MSHNSILGNRFVGSETYTFQLQTLSGVLLEQGVGHILLDGLMDNGAPYFLAGKEFKYVVIEPCGNTQCSGNIFFEDKTVPIITSPADVTLACSQVELQQMPLPSLSGAPSMIVQKRKPVILILLEMPIVNNRLQLCQAIWRR
jgi:hypothetical protein